MLIVGPEGGITAAEHDALTGAGAVGARLGPTVLRASSAGVVAAGLVLARASGGRPLAAGRTVRTAMQAAWSLQSWRCSSAGSAGQRQRRRSTVAQLADRGRVHLDGPDGLGFEDGHGVGDEPRDRGARRGLTRRPAWRSLCSVVLLALFACDRWLVPALGSAGTCDPSDGLLPDPVGELLSVPVGVGVGDGWSYGEVDVGVGVGVLVGGEVGVRGRRRRRAR